MPFHLVLAEADDLTALQLCRALGRVARTEFVTPDELLMASHWSHDPLGQSRVELARGIILDETSVLSIFNRVRHVSPPQFAGSCAADQIYASEEFFALVISWLTSFAGRCMNRPHSGSVAGYTSRSPTEDRLRLGTDLHASSHARHLGLGCRIAGFPEEDDSVRPGAPGQYLTESATRRVLIAGEALSDNLPAAQCKRLRAEMAHRQLTLAEATLIDTGSGWQLASINPLPEARNEAEIALIANLLLGVTQPEKGTA